MHVQGEGTYEGGEEQVAAVVWVAAMRMCTYRASVGDPNETLLWPALAEYPTMWIYTT